MKTIIFLLCMLPGLTLAADETRICPHNSFNCLEHHMEDFYLADHDRFYRVYEQSFARAMQCHDYQDVARYLTIYSSTGDNAEIDESLKQDTEAMLLLKPTCLFEGAARLTAQQLDNFIGSYRLYSRPNHVMTLLRKYMQNSKYQKIARRIYNANLYGYQSYGKDDEDAPMDELYQQYKHQERK